jgi:glycosyltransferase involved in cell wall biosynthesis
VTESLSPRRLKIALLSRSFSTQGGGAERYCVALATQLAQWHEVHVFAQSFDKPPDGITLHRIGPALRRPRWVNQLIYAWQTSKATRWGFDVVHSHENVWHGDVQTFHVKSVRGSMIGQRQGWRLVLVWLKVLASPRKLTYLALEAARCRLVAGRVQVAVSQPLAEEFRHHYPATPFEVISPGVDTPNQQRTRSQAQTQIGLALDKQWLLLVGNDFKRKGLDAALRALAQLPAQLHLAVAGDTAQQAHYVQMAEQLGVAQRLQFLGPLSDVTVAYQAVELLIHPTLEDSFGMVVLEAMASGLPVIVSGPAQCGLAAQLTHQVNAWLLQDPLNPTELADAVLQMLQKSELLEQIELAGRQFSALNGWPQAAQAYAKLYARVAGYRAAFSAKPNKAPDPS